MVFQPKNKKSAVFSHLAPFSAKWLGHRRCQNETRHFIGLSSSPDAELKTYMGILRAFLQAFRGTIRKIGQSLEGGFENKGAKSCPQNNLAPLVDATFDVDYDFDINHDPI